MASPVKAFTDPTTGVMRVMPYGHNRIIKAKMRVHTVNQGTYVFKDLTLISGGVARRVVWNGIKNRTAKLFWVHYKETIFYRDGIRRPTTGQIWPRTR